MRNLFPIVAAAAAAFVLTSCSTWWGGKETDKKQVNPEFAAAVPIETSRQAADRIIDQILTGMRKEDFKTFCLDFTPIAMAEFKEEGFKHVCLTFKDKWGTFQSRTYLGELEVGEHKDILWKGKFDKNKNDILISLRIGDVDGHWRVFGFGFH